jgi:cold shock CspA family protein
MRSYILAAAVLALLALPGAASAAGPSDLGPGRNAHVAVDGAGAAHVTWNEVVSGQLADVAHYCKVLQGASQCSSPHSFMYPGGANQGSDSGVWPLLPGDPRVLVVDARCCQQYAAKFVYSSADGGSGFDAGTNTANDNHNGAEIMGAALYAPAGAIGRPAESVLTLGTQATVGLSFQAFGTTGPPASSSPNSILTQGDALSGSLGRTGESLVAAWYHLDSSFVYWRKWSGSGDVNDSANWTPMQQLDAGNVNSSPRLASGPTGTYIVYNAGPSGADKTVVRRFNGTDWDAPTTLADPGVNRFDLAEDPGGSLHFVYVDSTDRLRYRFSTTPGDSTFSPAQTLAPTPAQFSGYTNLRVAATSGSGWITWEDGSPVHVHALAFKPSALAPPTEGTSVNVVPTKGKVFVKLPPGAANAKAGSGFVPLESLGRQVPVGSTLDTRKGTVRLFSATNSNGATQHGDFSSGLFNVSQGPKNPLTTVSMTGGGLSSCGKVPSGGSPKLATSAKKKRRSLFSNVHGRFRARGRNSTATVRGTAFRMTDTCTGTLTQVKRGTVLVRDLRLRKTRKVTAGHSYLARRGSR